MEIVALGPGPWPAPAAPFAATPAQLAAIALFNAGGGIILLVAAAALAMGRSTD